MKTGTTSVQSWLGQNQDWLREHGWVYPGWPMRRADKIGAVVDGLLDDQNLIISDEALWHFAGSERSDTRAIRDHLADFDVTVMVYLRRPDHYLEAWFAQGLKTGTGQHDVSRFLALPETGPAAMFYRLKLFSKLWDDAQLRFLPYEPSEFADGDIVGDFLARSGLPVPSRRKGAVREDKNRTPNADHLLLAGILRKVMQAPEDVITEVLRTGESETDVAGRRRLFRPDEVSQIRTDYRDFYRHIQRRFRSGTGKDFFKHYGKFDQNPAPVAGLRTAYDYLMSTVGDAESAARKP